MTIYKFAGFWRRLGAYTVDCTIILFIFIILTSIASLAFFSGAISGNSKNFIADLADPTRFSSIMILTWLFFISFNIAYFTYFHGTTGRTPGENAFWPAGRFHGRRANFLRNRFFKGSRLFCLGHILPRFYLDCLRQKKTRLARQNSRYGRYYQRATKWNRRHIHSR